MLVNLFWWIRRWQMGDIKIFNFQMSKLDTEIINETLEEVFNKHNSAAKNNIALGFVLRNIETGEYINKKFS